MTNAPLRPQPKTEPSDPAAPMVLRSGPDEARVRAWPGRSATAHLVLVDHTRAPHPAALRSWLDALAEQGYREVRTSAVTSSVAARLERAGFAPLQELALLSLDLDRAELERPSVKRRTVAGPDDVGLASDIDLAAFGSEWGLRPGEILDACSATPHHRARFALDTDRHPVGYAVTGRSGRRGFVQRLAVHPDHHRCGAGRGLVLDALRWLRRWRVTTVMVNTHLDNAPALALYERLGFERVAEQLAVLARPLSGPLDTMPEVG